MTHQLCYACPDFFSPGLEASSVILVRNSLFNLRVYLHPASTKLFEVAQHIRVTPGLERSDAPEIPAPLGRRTAILLSWASVSEASLACTARLMCCKGWSS